MTTGVQLRSILVVDDSPEDCQVVRRYLATDPTGAAYDIREAATGRLGVEAVRREKPDCVILDYDLPDLNGLTFLDQIRDAAGRLPTAAVMLTGKGSEAIAVQALRAGVQDYLVKGHFTAEVLTQTVGNAIRKTQLAADLERQQAEANRLATELAEANRNKDDFIALLAHELRNPLAPVRTGLEILRRKAGADSVVEQVRAMMARQVDHLVRLVDDLLDVSRIARGKVELRRELLDLVAVLRRTAEAAQMRIDSHGHRFEVDLPDTPIRVNGDPDRLEQVFSNLLTNAAKYTPPGGTIRLTAGVDGADAVVRVRDTGIGVRPEMRERIFETFTQSERADGQPSDGLGLGLALVRSLAELHGGGVTLESAGVGQGSEFIVHLPRIEAAAVEQPEPAGVEESTVAARRVLILDDNVDGANSLAELLRLTGPHQVEVAYTGTTAIELAKTFRPDVALLDVALPDGMDGYEVAERLRQLPGLGGIKLLTLTGFGQDGDRQRSNALGIVAHLVKPVEPQLLTDLLAQL